MGRQAAGQSLVRAIARQAGGAEVLCIGASRDAVSRFGAGLAGGGHRGAVTASLLPDVQVATRAGALYYPAPPVKGLAALRNAANPAAFSIFGVTHTLSSHNATDQIADLILPPFRPWDALICTSRAAHGFVTALHAEMQEYWARHTGAARFNPIRLPIIPLGVDVADFARDVGQRATARRAMGLGDDDVVFLFSGRLSFHAKANPGPVYQALQAVAATRKTGRIVCIEAGIYPNEGIRQGFLLAQQALAPDVAFVWADGDDAAAWRNAWLAGDVFLSLSDNIQETFGLTPVEAMAAGMPVIASDWNGYRDTVQDGLQGWLIPTFAPEAGYGADLALRHGVGADNYDFYIGRASLQTVVDPVALVEAMRRLADDADLRAAMGEAGRLRAATAFDWPVVLRQYDALCAELADIRRGQPASPESLPVRADPFHRFAHYPSRQIGADTMCKANSDAAQRLRAISELNLAAYGFSPDVFAADSPGRLLAAMTGDEIALDDAIVRSGLDRGQAMRALTWLAKFGMVSLRFS